MLRFNFHTGKTSMRSQRRLVAIGLVNAFVAAMMTCAGCGGGAEAGSGRARVSESAVGSMADTNAQLSALKTAVNNVVRDLDQLPAGGDLQKSFSTFTEDVAVLQRAGDKARQRWKDMQERGHEYVVKWQQEAVTVENPQVKAGMEQRRERVRANYDKLAAQTSQTAMAYDPFLKDVQEIQKALALDLSPGGVKALQPGMDHAKADGAALSRQLDTLQARVTDVMGDMSP
jgi:uncharacterized protein YacL (UPF0231 family)